MVTIEVEGGPKEINVACQIIDLLKPTTSTDDQKNFNFKKSIIYNENEDDIP